MSVGEYQIDPLKKHFCFGRSLKTTPNLSYVKLVGDEIVPYSSDRYVNEMACQSLVARRVRRQFYKYRDVAGLQYVRARERH